MYINVSAIVLSFQIPDSCMSNLNEIARRPADVTRTVYRGIFPVIKRRDWQDSFALWSQV